MKIKKGFVLRSLCNEHIVVGEGLAQVNFNKVVSLNDSAAYLWESVEGKEFTTEDLAGLLVMRYDVSAERAAADAAKVAADWVLAGIAD